MSLRITPQTTFDTVVFNAQQHAARLLALQQQAATGKRLIRPSDGPTDIISVMANHAQVNRLDVYVGNIQNARTTLDASVSALTDVNNLFSNARRIAIDGSQDTNNTTSREALAVEVDTLLTQLQQLANTQHLGRYLFAGVATATEPFTVASTDSQGRPLSVEYRGADQHAEVVIGPRDDMDTFLPGSEVFQQRRRGTTVYTGQTGAAPGVGSDSATGLGELIVRHTATTYAPGSGVQAGTSSAAGDTILGPAGAHVLTVVDASGTGASGTVSLNGGPPSAFTSAETDLKVIGPDGEVVFVNTTAITPGFSGNVDITAQGTLSTDGGASEIAIDFSSSNQVVTNSLTGQVTNVDSSNIRRAGTDQLEYSGTFDAFEILIALRDDLRNTRGLTPNEQSQAISRWLTDLERVQNGVLQVVGEQGASLRYLDSLEQRIQDVQLQIQARTSELEDADLTEVVLGLQYEETQLSLTLASAAQVVQPSLLDFIR